MEEVVWVEFTLSYIENRPVLFPDQRPPNQFLVVWVTLSDTVAGTQGMKGCIPLWPP